MDTGKVVVYGVNRKRMPLVLNLFAMRVRQTGKTAHLHPKREIVPLDVAGRYMRRFGAFTEVVSLLSDGPGNDVDLPW
jgi:hypothetical protein